MHAIVLIMKAFRRFRWQDVPKRKRQATYIGAIVATSTATMQYKFQECIEVVGNPAKIQNPNTLFWIRMLFGRMRSRWVGALAELHVPVAMRPTLYSAFAWKYGANIEEARYPLDSYSCFQEFFSRALQEDARPIAALPNGLVSPVDGKVLSLGFVDEPDARIEQVKGATYSLPAFLGEDPVLSMGAKSRICYAVMYLAPGNYHRFHSPCSFDISMGRHFCGELLPVREGFLKIVNDVFSVNERVVLIGRWRHGQMHLGAVGAANVGNIFLDFDPKLKTNRLRDITNHCGGDLSWKKYPEAVHLDAGGTLGGFKMGSTVVIVFEAPENFKFSISQQDLVRVGQPIGEVL